MSNRFLLTALLAGAIVMLSSCGGSAETGNSDLRFLNAAAGYPTLDLYLDDDREFTGVATGRASNYKGIDADTYSMAIGAPGNSTLLATADRTISERDDHTLVAYGREGALKTVLLREDEDEPDSGRARLRVLNTARDAGAVDVYIAANCQDLTAASPAAAGVAFDTLTEFATLLSGSYSLCITEANDATQLLLDGGSILLTSRQVATLIVTPTDGGVLVNAILATEGGSVQPFDNPFKRVRVVGAISGSPPLEVSAGAIDLGTGAGSPGVGEYVQVPASTLGLNVSIDGALVPGTPALPPTSGADLSVLVYGTVDSPQVAIITDNNQLPTTASTSRVRLLHAVAGLNETMTLTVSLSNRGTASYGTASARANMPTGSDQTVRVESPTAPTVKFSSDAIDFEADAVYTVFMLGSIGDIVGTVRRDR